MNEKDLLKKLTLFKKIEPNREWVLLTKERILETKKSFNIGEFLLKSLERSSLVLSFRALFIIIFFLIGSVFYLNYLNLQNLDQFLTQTSPQININNQKTDEIKKEEKVLLVLKEIQEKTNKIESSLNNLENLKDQKEFLGLMDVIKITAKIGEDTIKEVKENHFSPQVLANLVLVENDLKELKEKSNNLQKERITSLLKDLKQRTLTKNQIKYLQEVEEYYNKEKYNEAMILIFKLIEQ